MTAPMDGSGVTLNKPSYNAALARVADANGCRVICAFEDCHCKFNTKAALGRPVADGKSPACVKLTVCDTCGRTDRYGSLGNAHNDTDGEPCPGTLSLEIYVREDALVVQRAVWIVTHGGRISQVFREKEGALRAVADYENAGVTGFKAERWGLYP